MKLLHVAAACITLLTSLASFAEPSFIDSQTQHLLRFKRGTPEDFKWAKNFCIQFFKPSYELIKLDADQQQYSSYEEFIETKFSQHYANIFVHNQYQFFVVEDTNEKKYVGYTIIDVNGDKIYSIETQASIDIYSLESLFSGLSYFIKDRIEPKAENFISAVRRKMPHFVAALKSCNFQEVENAHLHKTLDPELYQALIRRF